jgi:site-specific recombinase XerD
MNEYERWLQEEGKSENTVCRYVRIAADFQEWHRLVTKQEQFSPQLVTPLDLQDWKTYLLSEATYQRTKNSKPQKYSVASVNNCIKGIKVFFDYCISTGEIRTNPAKKLKAHKIQCGDEGEPRWLDRAERSRFLFYIDNEQLQKKNAWRFARNRALSFVMLHAGLRVSEAVDLEPDDLNLTGSRKFLRVRNGKGGKSRIVEMNPDLIDALQVWLEERGTPRTNKLFISQRGGPLTEDGVTALFNKLRDKTGIPDLTPHVMRHTFAHDLAERGEPLQTIADLLGHSNVNYTRVSVTSSRDERQKAVNKLAGERFS